MSLMKFQRRGVVGVSSPDESTLGGKSRENLLWSTGVSVAEDEECLLSVTEDEERLLSGVAILLLMSLETEVISPSSVFVKKLNLMSIQCQWNYTLLFLCPD